MIGVVMTYYNRNAQLINTLNSFLQRKTGFYITLVVWLVANCGLLPYQTKQN